MNETTCERVCLWVTNLGLACVCVLACDAGSTTTTVGDKTTVEALMKQHETSSSKANTRGTICRTHQLEFMLQLLLSHLHQSSVTSCIRQIAALIPTRARVGSNVSRQNRNNTSHPLFILHCCEASMVTIEDIAKQTRLPDEMSSRMVLGAT